MGECHSESGQWPLSVINVQEGLRKTGDMARFGGKSKNLENPGNKMRVNLVSSIVFP
jgi:hypothetical protein